MDREPAIGGFVSIVIVRELVLEPDIPEIKGSWGKK